MRNNAVPRDLASDCELIDEEDYESEKLRVISRITVMHPDFKRVTDAVDGALKSHRTAGETICIRLFAEAGCGKSHVSNRFLRLYPPYRKNGQLIKRVLRVRVPSDPTIKGVSIATLAQLGDSNASKGTEQEKAERIDYLLRQCGVELWIVEELHHFVDAENDKRNMKVANWFKVRIEQTSIPVLASGLLRTDVLFDMDDQLEERFDGPYFLKPFIWFEQGPEPVLANLPFCSYLHLISTQFPFKDSIDFGARDNALRFFCISRGKQRRIGKLLKQAAMLAEEDNTETIDLPILKRAYDIRTGHRYEGSMNPFSSEFDLGKALEELKSEAKRPVLKEGEGVSDH